MTERAAPKRDPRIDPKPGDELYKFPYWNRRITRVTPDGVIEFQPLRDGEPWGGIQSEILHNWRDWAEEAEVLRNAD